MSQPDPPTLTNRLGTLASKMFLTTSAVQFSDLLKEFRAEVRAQVLTEAAGLIRADADAAYERDFSDNRIFRFNGAKRAADLLIEAASRPSGDR